MSDEQQSETSAVDSTAEPELTNSPVEPTAEAEASADVASAAQEPKAAEKPKAARKPRSAKAKAEGAVEAKGEPASEAKPKRKRTTAPKAEAADAEAPAAEKAASAKRPAAKQSSARKPAAAPRRRRSTRKPGEPAPVVRAQAKYVRSSARKARLVCDNIRGKSVEDARAILAHTPRSVARDWSALLESAVANAEHNHELVGEDLFIKAVHADEGPTIKRFRPRAMGRATKIRKRTAHLTILLTPKD